MGKAKHAVFAAVDKELNFVHQWISGIESQKGEDDLDGKSCNRPNYT